MPDRCWCARSALDDLLAEARRWPLRETGGALLGWRDANQTVIAQILGPGPKARHRLSSFEPDSAWQNQQGQRIYRNSGRTIRYLGDWHTHPRGTLRPSRQDHRTACLIAEDPAFQTPQPLYVIAGHKRLLRTRFAWTLAVYTPRGGNLHRVPLIVFDG
jgi:integrative and conjugative element protein (TIGR02256 family)